MQTGKQSKKYLFFAGLFILLVCSGGAGWFGYIFLTTPGPSVSHPVTIVVKKGASLQMIAQNLHAEGLLTNTHFLTVWARLSGRDRGMKTGEYLFTTPLSPLALLDRLEQGSTLRQAVTIPEGLTLAQIAVLLEKKELGSVESFLCVNADPQFLAGWGLPANSLEGYLYPATYQFSVYASAEEILGTMIARFYAAMDVDMYRRAAELGLSLHELVTFASLVEKETGAAVERPLVAAVFHNRLRKGIRLQCDPTVIYGIKDFDGNITRRHLRTPSPYNTYVIRGLPRGPIANPGLAALQATLYPASNNYLYFVARGDGTHQFSKSLVEHNRAVRRFQKRG
jgi:UPF0755 protein